MSMTLSEARSELKNFRRLSGEAQLILRLEVEDAVKVFLNSWPSEDEFVEEMDGIILTARIMFWLTDMSRATIQ